MIYSRFTLSLIAMVDLISVNRVSSNGNSVIQVNAPDSALAANKAVTSVLSQQ